MTPGVAGNLGLLCWFKYYGFFAVSLDNALHGVGLGSAMPLVQMTLPVGISFFTFMGISYVVDVYRGDTKPAPWLDFAVYHSFFPHLIAGPIVRANELIPQIQRRRDPRSVDVARAAYLIWGGLFKKVVLSSFLAAAIVDPVFGAPTRTRRWRSWSPSTPTRCRSTPTSAATRTSRSASRCCSGSGCRRTSTRRTRRGRSRSSGGAGT